MPGPGLIADYLGVLARQLPGPVVEELADGLEETCRRYAAQGMRPDAAAEAAVAEFGDPGLIVAEFARAHPARHAAHRLLRLGPVVGSCWAVALITGRAWAWPVPVAVGVASALALMTVIALLALATLSTGYRAAARAGTAGCVGTAALDVSVIIGVAIADPAVTWAAVMAMAASAIRVCLSARLLRPVMTRAMPWSP